MNFFDGSYHEVVQTLDVEVIFTFPYPPPKQIFPPAPVTISFVDDTINYKGDVKWLCVEPRTMFSETVPFNGTRIGIARGAFAVAKNSLGGLMFEFITEGSRVSGFLSNWEEITTAVEYTPEYEMFGNSIPTLEEIAAQLKLRFRPR